MQQSVLQTLMVSLSVIQLDNRTLMLPKFGLFSTDGTRGTGAMYLSSVRSRRMNRQYSAEH